MPLWILTHDSLKKMFKILLKPNLVACKLFRLVLRWCITGLLEVRLRKQFLPPFEWNNPSCPQSYYGLFFSSLYFSISKLEQFNPGKRTSKCAIAFPCFFVAYNTFQEKKKMVRFQNHSQGKGFLKSGSNCQLENWKITQEGQGIEQLKPHRVWGEFANLSLGLVKC